ncbi:NADH:flavin oxidoreductase/NADH oxidase [Variovorax sp.]|jgi:2,4-dienoyl-CoA reductase-like NADH-dependent reductase (Old Yellow Enzyme family)|uniref:NADH:flavin oxidoreductase/NADH oxidase n=1 Tax=Variovorax sp. TaxID=1871043 RepID=UPI0037DA1A0F
MPSLFSPFTLKDVTLKNRMVVSPMCQYSAIDGVVNDWHHVHLSGLARGGAALVIAEATAVSPEGRITPGRAGIWTDAQAEAWRKIVASVKAAGAVPGIQIAHAGRKASANRPWEGDDHIADDDARGWQTIAPSAVAFGGGLPKVPEAMTLADIERVKADFVAAARRALGAGFEWLELHFAHGYLAQSFFSTWSNLRTDAYGGDFEGRARFLIETLAAVREVWPERLPLAARFGITEFAGQDDLEEGIELVRRLKAAGLDFIDVSIGFSTPKAKIPWGPALMAPIAQRVRRETGLPATTSWFISEPRQADELVAGGTVDLVTLGRPLLANPHWPYRAALELGVDKAAWTLPAPYAHWLERYRSS